MRGIAHCSTHHTRGRALFERQASPPHCQRKPKAGKPRLQALTEREASLNKRKFSSAHNFVLADKFLVFFVFFPLMRIRAL